MSRALTLVEHLDRLLLVNENGLVGMYSIFTFRGFPAGGGAFGGSGNTPSTKNVEDNLRAHSLVMGIDYEWVTPRTLKLLQSRINVDLLNSIDSSGGQEVHEAPSTERAEEHE